MQSPDAEAFGGAQAQRSSRPVWWQGLPGCRIRRPWRPV